MKKSIVIILTIAIILFGTLLPNSVYSAGNASQGVEKLDNMSGNNGNNGQSDNNSGNSGNSQNTGNSGSTESSEDSEEKNNSESSDTSEDNDESSDSSSDEDFYQTYEDVEKEGLQNYKGIIDTGLITANGEEHQSKENAGVIATIMKPIIRFLAYIIQSPSLIISIFTTPYLEGAEDGDEIHWFTIQDTVFGKISLFDINFFDIENGDSDKPNIEIKKQVRNWYYVLRDIAIMAGLLILIYTGIRIAMSVIPEDQAKYKQMFVGWLKSMIILLALPYILMITMWIANSFLKIIPNKDTTEGFEARVVETVNNRIEHESVLTAFMSLITLGMLTYYQIKFFVKYLFRFFKASFLVIISPIITITYSLDKGKSHNNWLNDYVSIVFMQVIHALIYSIFMFSASEIAARAPIIAVAFFMALARGEKIFSYLFNLKSQDSK